MKTKLPVALWRPFARIAAILVALAALDASAQAILPPMTGDWTIGRTSEWPDICTLGLLPSETIGGWDVKLHRDCVKSFAWSADITAWRMVTPDELVLADATRHGVIHFKHDETGDWVGAGPDGQDYVITRVRPRRAPPASAPHKKS
jgi:hypothetical protein